MTKRLTAFLRAFVIITMLVAGPAQTVFAGHAPNTVSDGEADVGFAPRAYQLDPECAISVNNGYLGTEPGTDEPDLTWPPDSPYPQWPHGMEIDPSTDIPGGEESITPLVTVPPGTTTWWLVAIQNVSGMENCFDVGAETLININVTMTFQDYTAGGVVDSIQKSVDFVWPDPMDPNTLAEADDIAWAKVPYTIPADIQGNVRIITSYSSDIEGYAMDIIDQDRDMIGVDGPAFGVVSFEPSPTTATAGQPVDFTLVIRNTRPATSGTVIRQIRTGVGDLVACDGIGQWQDVAGDTAGDTAGDGVVQPGEHAICEILAVPVPDDPVPEQFRLSGEITVWSTADETGHSFTDTATSDPAIDVAIPDISVDKRITGVTRAGSPLDLNVEDPRPGDEVQYEITIENTGEVELFNLFIVDSLLGPLYASQSSLAPSDDPIVLTPPPYVVQLGGQDPLQNTVTVTADAAGYASVEAQAVASLDIADSVLDVELSAAPVNAPDGLGPGATVHYELTVTNNGAAQINSLTVLDLVAPLQTVGLPVDFEFTPDYIGPGQSRVTGWDYLITEGDEDPLTSTIRIRGREQDGGLLYAQDQVTLDLVSPGILIEAEVTSPAGVNTVLRGQTVQYQVTVTNTGQDIDTEPLCDILVNQLRRDPNTGIAYPVATGLPMNWAATSPGVPDELDAGHSVVGTASYAVTGDDVDPLHMIFEVSATNCAETNPTMFSDRTSRVLDLSDVQLNTSLSATRVGPIGETLIVNADNPAPTGAEVTFTYSAISVSQTVLEGITANWSIVGRAGNNPVAGLASSLGAFEQTTGTFTYPIADDDINDSPLIFEVTLTGTDDKGNDVAIRTAMQVPVAVPNLTFVLDGPGTAVLGDTITFDYTIVNEMDAPLDQVVISNLLTDPISEEGYFETISNNSDADQNLATGSFEYTIDSLNGIQGDKLLMRVRLDGSSGETPVVATASHEVEILPMVSVTKSGPSVRTAGTPVTYNISIRNNSQHQYLKINSYRDEVLESYGITITDDDFGPWTETPGVLPPGPGPESVVSSTEGFTIPSLNAYPNPLINTFVVTGVRAEDALGTDGIQVSGSDTHVLEVGCPIEFAILPENLDNDIDWVLGEEVQWSITLRNKTQGTIDNIHVFEELYWGGNEVPWASINWPGDPGVLQQGQVAQILFENNEPFFVERISPEYYPGNGEGEMTDTAWVTFDPTAGTGECQDSVSRALYSPVQVRKIPDKPLALTGEVVTYTLVIENVTETDDAPYDRFFVTAEDSMLLPKPMPFAYNGTTESVEGWLEPGASVEKDVTYTVQAGDPDQLVNEFTAIFRPDQASPDLPEDEKNIDYIVSATAEVYTGNPLDLIKIPSQNRAAAGETIAYNYTIYNRSPYDVVVTKATDDQLLAVDGDVNEPLIPDYMAVAQVELDPYTSYEISDIPFTIPLDARGTLRNTFEVTAKIFIPDSGWVPFTNSVTASVALEETDLTLEKWIMTDEDKDGVPETPVEDVSGVPDGIPDVESGTEVYYCFSVGNSNPGTLTSITGIQIQDNQFPTLQADYFEPAVDALHADDGNPDNDNESNTLYGGEEVEFCAGPQPLVHSPVLGDPRTNVVTVEGTTDDDRTLYNRAETTVDIQGSTLLVTKLPSQTTAYVGDELTYTITLRNNLTDGYAIEIDKVVDDFISGSPEEIPLDWFDWGESKYGDNPDDNPGWLAPGGIATFTRSYVVREDDPDPLENTVRVTGWLNDAEQADERTEVFDNTRAVVAITDSILVARKDAHVTYANASPENCDPAIAGDCNELTYTITVTNQSGSGVTVHNLTVVDRYWTYDDATGQMVLQERIFDTEDELGKGKTELDPWDETAFVYHTIPMPTASAIAAAAGGEHPLDPFINRVSVYGQILDENGQPIPWEEDPNGEYGDFAVRTTAVDTVDIIQPGLRVSKVPQILAAAPGQTVPYDITITNTGDAVLKGFVVNDQASANGPDDVDGQCAEDSVDPCEWFYEGEGTVPYDPDAGLAPGEKLLGTVEVTVPVGWTDPEFVNVVEVTATNEATQGQIYDSTAATIDVRDEGIDVQKFTNMSSAPVGSPVEYTLQVTNLGQSPIQSLQITDEGWADSPVTVGAGEFPNTDGADADTLDPGETYTTSYEHVISAADGEVYINRVSVTALTDTGRVLLNVDSAIVAVETASLEVEKFVCVGDEPTGQDSPPPVDCGTTVNIGDDVTPDTVTYYLHLINDGRVDVNITDISDSVGTPTGLPATLNAETDIWKTYTYDVQPNDPDPLTNIVVVMGTVAETGDTLYATDSAELALVTGDLVVTKTGVDEATVGTTVPYTVTVTHAGATGAAPIENIQVYDPLSDQDGSNPLGNCTPQTTALAAGETLTCDFTHEITQADASPLVNTAWATGTQDSVPVGDQATHTLTIVTPGLSVTKVADTEYATIGDTVMYTYTVRNTGTTSISDLVVTESDPTADFTADPWPGYLLPDQEAIRTWTRTMSATDNDPYTNTVTVTGTVAGEPIMAEASETVYLANGALVVTSEPNVTFARSGEDIIFTYTIDNVGDSTLHNVELTDNLCFTTAEAVVTELAPSDPAIRKLCTITASLPGPMVSNVYVAANTGSPTGTLVSDTATAEVGVTDGGVLLTKTANVRTVTTTAPDNEIMYTVTVENVGDEPLGNIVVEDALVDLQPQPPATLQPGGSHRMTGTYTHTDATLDSIENAATVTATGVNTGATYSDSDSAVVAVLEDPNAILIVTKAANPLVADPGDTITYTYTVQNISGQMATDIYLSDQLVPEFQNGILSLPDMGPGHIIQRTYNVNIPASYTEPEFPNTVRVFSPVTNPPTLENLQDTATVTVDVNLLTLTKAVVGEPVLNEETPDVPNDFVVIYQFTVTNNSTAAVPNVTLVDDMVDQYGGTWTTPLPNDIPGSGQATAQATVIVTEPAGSIITNEATLFVNGIEEATASAEVELSSTGLAVQNLRVWQEAAGEPLLLVSEEPAPVQTGEPVLVEFDLTNTGTTDLTNLDYSVAIEGLPDTLTCDKQNSPGVPATLAAGENVTLTCEFDGLPIGVENYSDDSEPPVIDLQRDFTVTAKGYEDPEDEETEVTDTAATEVEIVDLKLGVDLEVTGAGDAEAPWLPGDEIAFTLTISNEGASPIGCLDIPECRLTFDGDDDLTEDGEESFLDKLFGWINDEAAAGGNYLGNLVLQPGESRTFDAADNPTPDPSLVFEAGFYVVQADDVTLDLVAMVSGGYYSVALESAGLLDEYVVHGEDVAELLEIGTAEIEITSITVSPNPPIAGQPVSYRIIITNTGAVPVSNLAASYTITPYANTSSHLDGYVLTSGDASPRAQQVSGTLTLPVTTLQPGAQIEAILSKTEDQTGAYEFQVTVRGSGLIGDVMYEPYDVEFVTITPVGTEELDPSATEPEVTKTVSSETAQPGGTLVWTVTVRNGWTQAMTNVLVQDSVPGNLTITNVSVDRGSISTEGQYVLVEAGQLNPGESVTLTVSTQVGANVAAPAAIANTACAQNGDGPQSCATATSNVGPDVGGLPATGIADITPSPDANAAGMRWAGMLSISLLAGLMLMGAAVSRRRAWVAALFVLAATAIVVVAVVLALSGGDGESDDPTDVADRDATATPVETDGGDDTLPDGPADVVPPTPTPYVVPTPAGVRTLTIPKLGEQFDVPVPIVDLPIVDRQWDVSGLGHYVGWLEGTTWMDSGWGNTVLAAHVQLGHQNPGPFWGLGELKPGDEIIVQEGDIERRFEVQSTTKVDPNDWTVTAPTSAPMLTLITCTEWDNNYGVFSQRMVVRAVPVGMEATG